VTTGTDYLPFSAQGTFAGVPRGSLDDLGGARVAIVGAPFDWGSTYRTGARFAPKAIREADCFSSDGSRPHIDSGVDALRVLGVVDVGDVAMPPGYIEESLERLTGAVEKVSAAGTIPIVLGGDHTITFANATGVARVHGAGSFALVHFDAHADTAETSYGMLHGHGTPMRRLIESGAVPGHRFVQIGLRGYWPPPEVFEWMDAQGMRTYPMRRIAREGLDVVVDEAIAYASEGVDAVFLSVDIDVVDPGMAPGTGTPEPGGITARELLDTVNRVGRELNVIGADLVEVLPAYDGPAETTATLANRVVLELLDGIAGRSAPGGA
jgi:agmatinase